MAWEDILLKRHYPSIRLFVTQEVNFQEYDRARIPSKSLIQECVERFQNDQYQENGNSNGQVNKDTIIDAINKMRKDGIITVEKADGVKLVSLRGDEWGSGKESTADEDYIPSQDLDLTQERSTEPSTSEERGEEELNTGEEHANAGPHSDGEHEPGRDPSEDNSEDQHHSNEVAEETDAMRHSEAYAEMTRSAVPLLSTSDDDSSPIRTPSRKRKRIMEIAASDTGSSMDPNSSHRNANSTPRRSHKRFLSEQPESRRCSDPANMFSPSKRYSPVKALKEERRDNSPEWLLNLVEKLRLKYPNDSFHTENGSVICVQCNGKRFQPPGRSLHNLDTHLRSKTHKDNAAKRIEKHGLPQPILPNATTQVACKDNPTGAGMPWVQQPLQSFAYKDPRRVPKLREQLFREMEAVDQQKEFEMSRLALNLNKFEKNTKDQLEQVEASIQDSDKKSTDKLQHMSEIVQNVKEKARVELHEMGERVDLCEARMSEQLEDIKTNVEQLDKKMYEELDDMTGRLARSDLRNIDQIEKVKNDFEVFKQNLEGQIGGLIKMLENFYGGKEELERMRRGLKKENQIHQQILTARLEDLEQANQMSQEALSRKVAELEQGNRIHEGLIKKVSDLEQTNQKLQNDLIERMAEFEKTQQSFIDASKVQQGQMDDLELQYQIQTGELDRQRESDLAFKSSILQQMEAHFDVTNKKMKIFEKESEARAEAVKRQSEERFKELVRQKSERFEEFEKASSKRIRELEKQNKMQRQSILRYDQVIPELIKENHKLRQEMLDLQDESDADDSDSSHAARPERRKETSDLLES